jgi:hypothetical protein
MYQFGAVLRITLENKDRIGPVLPVSGVTVVRDFL